VLQTNAEPVSVHHMAQPVALYPVFTAVDTDEPQPVAPPGWRTVTKLVELAAA
jgi:hypothetical protein